MFPRVLASPSLGRAGVARGGDAAAGASGSSSLTSFQSRLPGEARDSEAEDLLREKVP